VRIKRPDGGGWIPEWTRQYLDGHRGLIGFALEVENIDEVYRSLQEKQIHITPPEPLSFRWFFNRLTKTMPWRNAYLPPFTGIPFQFFLQQMNDDKSRQFMEQYMVPNSSGNRIEGISEVVIYGSLSSSDRELVSALFTDCREDKDTLTVTLGTQKIVFIPSDTYRVEVVLNCNNQNYIHKQIDAGNLRIRNS
jgi:hypothetical protein